MLVHRRVVPSINCADIHFCTWVGRGTVRVLSCPRTSHSVPSQGRTRTARTTVTQSNDEITYILYIRRSPYDSVKYLFNLIPLRKDNLRPDCSKLQLSKMAALPLSETDEARIIIKTKMSICRNVLTHLDSFFPCRHWVHGRFSKQDLN